MLIKHHIIIGLLLSIIFFNKDTTALILFFSASVLIDADHYLTYWLSTKNYTLNYFKIKKWCLKEGIKMKFYFIFHNIWFLTCSIILTANNKQLLPITLGILTHYILDIIWDMYWYKKGITKKPYRRWAI